MLTAILTACAVLSPGDPPNIIFVLADDLGYGEMGCFGQEHIPTPSMDGIAADGAMLTEHWAGSPVCAPSRCVLLTGQHPGHAPVRGNWENAGWGNDQPEGQYPLPEASITMGEVLKDVGYATCFVGKWGNGGPGSHGHPNRQGFDHFYGYLCQRVAHNYYPTHLWRNDERDMLEGNEEWFAAHQKIEAPLSSDAEYWDRYTAGTWACDAMIDEADAWMRQQIKRDTPFLLVYASPVPHLALQIPPDQLEPFAHFEETPYLGNKSYLPHPRPRAAYAAMINAFDAEIGRLMQTLEETSQTENTIIVVTSDNGPSWVGGVDMAFFNSQGGLRGRKGQIWEGGLRVPTVIRWPGVVVPGSSVSVASGFEDWLPTFAAAAGAHTPAEVDGMDLRQVLTTNTGPERVLYREFPSTGSQAVRMGPWKAVRNRLKRGDLTIELYNVEVDPAESNNVADDHPDVVAQCARIMQDEHEPSPVFPLPGIDTD
ncbi:MAG: sulfatase-like hydrolase/transferase [Phycisphaerales bacterium]|nr:sulfatase-like hydrolase/transferase [Phycisphaerales bacterium]